MAQYLLLITPCSQAHGELVHRPLGDSLNQHQELAELSPMFLFWGTRELQNPIHAVSELNRVIVAMMEVVGKSRVWGRDAELRSSLHL